MMPFFKYIILLVAGIMLPAFSALAYITDAFVPQKGIVVLDMAERNGDDETMSGDFTRQLYSAQYLCDIAGYPYTTTSSVDEAMTKGGVILFSSRLLKNTFTVDELQSLVEWVKNGGILVSPLINTTDAASSTWFSALFGIDASKITYPAKTFSTIEWDESRVESEDELEYFDEAEELSLKIGEIKASPVVTTTADVLARFDGELPAVTRNRLGRGAAYLVGLLWRDVVQRPQLTKQPSNVTPKSNKFSAFTDVWALLLRSIYAKSVPVSAWKFTAPEGYTQVLVPTHDCDSNTAYQAMGMMGDYEKSKGLDSHFFLTVHYYRDKDYFPENPAYFSAFYNDETIGYSREILNAGHTVGSHSIGHFPDFNKTDNMDIVTKEEYPYRATCVNGVSQGVSTWAEIVLSKNILEEDLGNKVRSFRPGHLCVNKDVPEALCLGNYDFASMYTASSVLGNNPFYLRMGRDWAGELTDVLQIPIHISDVYSSSEYALNDSTWNTHPCVDDWISVMNKLKGNYSSAVLLIHPNRDWKVTLEDRLVEAMEDEGFGLMNFEDYGEWWNSRLTTDYQTCYYPDEKVLAILTDLDKLEISKLTFAIEARVEVEKVMLYNEDMTRQAPCLIKPLAEGRLLAVPFKEEQSEDPEGPDDEHDSLAFMSNDMCFNISEVYDVYGNRLHSTDAPGFYIIKSSAGKIKKVYKK